MEKILSTEEMLSELKESLKKGDFVVEESEVGPENKSFWKLGRSDGQDFMKKTFNSEKVFNDADLNRFRGLMPADDVVENYVSNAGIDLANQEEVDAYVQGFYSACEQGWPPLDH